MQRFVNFFKWCKDCKHFKEDEVKDPCDECLENPVNEDSRKPVKFEES